MICFSVALAGFYHPADVAGESARYAEASGVSASKAAEAQRKARALATALGDFEEANGVLGTGPSARHAALQKQYNRDLAVLQQFVDQQIEAFDLAFQAALQRALAAHPGARRCQREIPKGKPLPGMRARMERNPECQGDDLNQGLAGAMDNDAVLAGALKQVNSRAWPDFEIEQQPLAVDGDRWISAPRFFRAHLRDPLRQIRAADAEERSAFYVAIEQGASQQELEGMVEAAKGIDAKTAARRLAVGAPILARAEVVFAKKAPGAAWCAQPVVFGGCAGQDATDALQAVLLADKKLTKVLP